MIFPHQLSSLVFILVMVLMPGIAMSSEDAAPVKAKAKTDEHPTSEHPTGDATLMPRVKMETSLGDFIIELNGEKAPISAINFIRYAADGYYNGTIYHRVIHDFMIQGGGFTPDGQKKEEGLQPPIANEWKNGLKNKKGTLAMARLGRQPDSATSQFFINVKDNDFLDQPRDGAGYTVFGKVVEGMDTVEKIRAVSIRSGPGGLQNFPTEPIVINKVTPLDTFDEEAANRMKAEREEEERAERAALEAERGEKLEKSRGNNAAEVNRVRAEIEKEAGKKMETTDSGLLHVVLKEGAGGARPKPTDKVTVHYRGTFLNGEQFDSSYDRGEPTSFGLNQVIKGWTEGVALMTRGEKRKFIIPSDLAYGPRGRSGIPADSPLVFEIELVDF